MLTTNVTFRLLGCCEINGNGGFRIGEGSIRVYTEYAIQSLLRCTCNAIQKKEKKMFFLEMLLLRVTSDHFRRSDLEIEYCAMARFIFQNNVCGFLIPVCVCVHSNETDPATRTFALSLMDSLAGPTHEITLPIFRSRDNDVLKELSRCVCL